jgi:hypothetical protein
VGSVLAVIGDPGDPALEPRLLSMAARSPYRGATVSHVERGIALAVQARGTDASLAVGRQLIVAFHGYVGNWREVAEQLGQARDHGSMADRIARAFEQVGTRLLPWLRGEYALVVCDRRQGSVLAARGAPARTSRGGIERPDVVVEPAAQRGRAGGAAGRIGGGTGGVGRARKDASSRAQHPTVWARGGRHTFLPHLQLSATEGHNASGSETLIESSRPRDRKPDR